MGNYEQLKAAIAAVIKQNGNNEITGDLLQNTLTTIVSNVGNDSTFAGVATPDTVPGSPDQNVFYIAGTRGVYNNFDGTTIVNEMVVFTNETGVWTSQNIGIALNGVPNLFLGVGYVRKDNGNINTPSSNFTNTPFLPIDRTKDLQIKAYEGVTNLMAFCAFYDSDYKFISVWQPGGAADGTRTATIPANQIPENTVYIRCSGLRTVTDNYVIPFDLYNVLVNLSTKADINAVISQINTYLNGSYVYRGWAIPSTVPVSGKANIFYLATEPGVYVGFGNFEVTNRLTVFLRTNPDDDFIATEIGVSLNGVRSLFREIGYIRNTDGKVNTGSVLWRCTPYLHITGKDDLQIRGQIGENAPLVALCAFYDKDYNFISAFTPEWAGNAIVTVKISAADIPANTVYIRCTGSETLGYVLPWDIFDLTIDVSETNNRIKNISDRLDDVYKEVDDIPPYLHIIKDEENKIIGYIKNDGSVEFYKGGFSNEVSEIGDIPGVLKAIKDENGNIIMLITENGVEIPNFNSKSLNIRLRGIELTTKANAAAIDKNKYYQPQVENAVLVEKGKFVMPGNPLVNREPIFCVHDDDTIDMNIPTSSPSSWMNGGGYLTTLYPLLQSLGLRGNLAAEGQRTSLTNNVPQLNANGEVAKKLQDERGWEIMAHSMTARYEYVNYLVESLDSDLAITILENSTYAGETSNNTTSVYVSSENKNYMVNANKEWVEVPTEYIKPYIKNYETDSIIMYNPTFPIWYQWGKWLEIATQLGFKTKCWVTSGDTTSHANVKLINKYIPWGFGNLDISQVNIPPLTTTVVRLPMEQQPNYKGEQDPDNSYKPELLASWKKVVDEAVSKKGWVIFALHAYRPCWLNKLPGSLVSEGGTYPDEWVYPARNPTEYPDNYLEPPTEKGINNWSDWTPCPNTRLYMLYEILQYAKEKGMFNVTSTEAFEKMGNLVNVGIFLKGGSWGVDKKLITYKPNYPHYIVGIDDSQDYFND